MRIQRVIWLPDIEDKLLQKHGSWPRKLRKSYSMRLGFTSWKRATARMRISMQRPVRPKQDAI